MHRNLNPGVLLLTENGQVKITDFKLAKMLTFRDFGHYMDQIEIDTCSPKYSSPEVLEGKAHDLKTDIWSLGTILYEFCTLKTPETKKDNLKINANVSPALNALLSDML